LGGPVGITVRGKIKGNSRKRGGGLRPAQKRMKWEKVRTKLFFEQKPTKKESTNPPFQIDRIQGDSLNELRGKRGSKKGTSMGGVGVQYKN